MRKSTLLVAAALMATAFSAKAEQGSVEGTITWPMVKTVVTEGVDEATGEPTTTTTYEFVKEATLSATVAEYLTASDVTLGNLLTFLNGKKTGDIDVATFQPTEKLAAGAAIEGADITFTVTPKDGYQFQPTKISYKMCVVGTDGGNYFLTYTYGGNSVELKTDEHPARNNEANGYFSDENIAVEPAAADGAFGLVFSLCNLAANKQIGLCDVIISGNVIGDVTAGIVNVNAAEENAPMYNLQGVQVDENYKGVVIKNGKKFINK